MYQQSWEGPSWVPVHALEEASNTVTHTNTLVAAYPSLPHRVTGPSSSKLLAQLAKLKNPPPSESPIESIPIRQDNTPPQGYTGKKFGSKTLVTAARETAAAVSKNPPRETPKSSSSPPKQQKPAPPGELPTLHIVKPPTLTCLEPGTSPVPTTATQKGGPQNTPLTGNH